MKYVSTRGQAPSLDFQGVTLAGLASDGGLYVPEAWPQFSADEIAAMAAKGKDSGAPCFQDGEPRSRQRLRRARA